MDALPAGRRRAARADRRRRDRRGPLGAGRPRGRRASTTRPTGCSTSSSAAGRCSTSASTSSPSPRCCSGRRTRVVAAGSLFPSGADAEAALLLDYGDGRTATLTDLAAQRAARARPGSSGRRAGSTSSRASTTRRRSCCTAPAPSRRRSPGRRLGAGYAHELIEVTECLRAGRTESAVMPLADTLAVQDVLGRGGRAARRPARRGPRTSSDGSTAERVIPLAVPAATCRYRRDGPHRRPVPRRTFHGTSSKALAAVVAKFAGAGTVAQVAAGLGIAAAGVTGAGAAGALPGPVQDVVASAVETVSPIDLPHPRRPRHRRPGTDDIGPDDSDSGEAAETDDSGLDGPDDDDAEPVDELRLPAPTTPSPSTAPSSRADDSTTTPASTTPTIRLGIAREAAEDAREAAEEAAEQAEDASEEARDAARRGREGRPRRPPRRRRDRPAKTPIVLPGAPASARRRRREGRRGPPRTRTFRRRLTR